MAVASERLVERPEEFSPARFLPLPDLSSELTLIARTYLESAERQRMRHRLIEEFRKIPALRNAEREANTQLFAQLSEWVASKPSGKGLGAKQRAHLTMMAFGPILFLATKIREGVRIDAIDDEDFVRHWVEQTTKLLERIP